MMLRLGVLAMLVFVGQSEAEPVVLQISYPAGRIAQYKNKYSLEYFSNKAEIIESSGSFEIRSYGEWRSREIVQKIEEDTIKVVATVDKAGSQVILAGQRLSYEQFPYTLDLINDRAFSWGIAPGGAPVAFSPEFPVFRVDRQDLITDLRQVWMPGLALVLPEGPVEVGDTWVGQQEIEVPFYRMSGGNKPSLMWFTSTYKIKKFKKKKGHRVVEIDEERKIRYRGWIHVELASLIVDGEGSGDCKWVIDVDRGIVLVHEMKMGIGRPQVRQAREKHPIEDIEAQVEVVFSRKLEKLE